MDEEVVIIGADGTEHVFPAGFDPKRAAEIVRGQSAPGKSPSSATAGALTALGGMTAAPYLVRGVNAGAKAVSAVDPVITSIIGGAFSNTGAALGAGVPKAAGLIEKLAGGPLARGAGWLSRAAGTAAVPLTFAGLLMDAKALEDKLTADQSIDPAEKALIRQRIARPFEQ